MNNKFFLKVGLAVICLRCVTLCAAAPGVMGVSATHNDVCVRAFATVTKGPYEITPVSGDVIRGETFQQFDSGLYFLVAALQETVFSGKAISVLDYACGTGQWAAASAVLAEAHKRSISFCGVDPYLEDEHHKFYTKAMKVFELSRGGALLSRFTLDRLPLSAVDDASYGVITLSNALHLFSEEDKVSFFNVCKRKIIPGGIVVVQVPVVSTYIRRNLKLVAAARRKGHPLPTLEESFNGGVREFLALNLEGDTGLRAKIGLKLLGVGEVIELANSQGWGLGCVEFNGKSLQRDKKSPLSVQNVLDWCKAMERLKCKIDILNLCFNLATATKDKGLQGAEPDLAGK